MDGSEETEHGRLPVQQSKEFLNSSIQDCNGHQTLCPHVLSLPGCAVAPSQTDAFAGGFLHGARISPDGLLLGREINVRLLLLHGSLSSAFGTQEYTFLGGSQPSPEPFSLLVFSGSFHLTH